MSELTTVDLLQLFIAVAAVAAGLYSAISNHKLYRASIKARDARIVEARQDNLSPNIHPSSTEDRMLVLSNEYLPETTNGAFWCRCVNDPASEYELWIRCPSLYDSHVSLFRLEQWVQEELQRRNREIVIKQIARVGKFKKAKLSSALNASRTQIRLAHRLL